MKKLKWFLAVLSVFLVLSVGLAYWSRPYLTNLALKKAGEMVGAPVTLSHAEINVLAGGLVIHDLKVGDFLTIQKVVVRLPLLALLKKQKPAPNITMTNGKYTYRDRAVGKTTILSDIDAKIKGNGTFSIQTRLDDKAPLSVKGSGDLFAKQISFEAKAALKQLPLSPFEPYYDDPTGKFRIIRGSVTLTGPVTCKKNKLHSPLHATVHNLEIEPKQQMLFGFAADKVLAELKDQKGNLELDLLISGDIKSPQFRLLTDLNRAIGNAIAATLIKEIPKAIESLPQELNPQKLIPKDVQEGIDKLKGIFGQ